MTICGHRLSSDELLKYIGHVAHLYSRLKGEHDEGEVAFYME